MRCRSRLLRKQPEHAARFKAAGATTSGVHPDTFEGTVTTVDHKKRICRGEDFCPLHVTDQTADVDRKIMQVRRGLEF